jgi:hypothetical protein
MRRLYRAEAAIEAAMFSGDIKTSREPLWEEYRNAVDAKAKALLTRIDHEALH